MGLSALLQGSSSRVPLRNLLLDGSGWIGLGVTTALLGSLLAASSRMAGMDPTGLAVLTMLPFAASLVSVVSGRIGPRSPRGLMAFRAVGSAALLCLLVGPATPVIIAAVAIFWLTFMLGMPLQQRLWGVMYPSPMRGRLLGAVGTVRFAAGAVAILIAARMAEDLGGFVVIGLGGVLGVGFALAVSRLDVPPLERQAEYSIERAIRIATERPRLRAITLGYAVFGAGFVAAMPLITLLQVDRLGLSLAEIGALGVAASVATTLAYAVAGVAADRRGAAPVMVLGSLIGAAGMTCYVVAGGWPLLIAASILLGVSFGMTELMLPLLIAERAAPIEQAPASAGMNAIWGARGLVAPFVATLTVSLGIAGIRGALLACAATMAVGALLFLRLADDEEVVQPGMGDATEASVGSPEAVGEMIA